MSLETLFEKLLFGELSDLLCARSSGHIAGEACSACPLVSRIGRVHDPSGGGIYDSPVLGSRAHYTQ